MLAELSFDSNPFTASMDPPPTANPHAELVAEYFEDCPRVDSPARSWSPIASPDKQLWWGVDNQPAVNEGEEHF